LWSAAGTRAGFTPSRPSRTTGKRVAVVGSGPAGLAAAQQLRRAGHSVTVYEKNDRIGGLLRYGIPNFKLEKHVVDRRIEQMRAEGVKFVTNAHVGVNTPVEAAYLPLRGDSACGGSEQPRDLNIPGRELKGIHFAMEFLPQQNRRNEGDTVDPATAILATGKRVLIIGGGDTGADCLGTSLRQGAKSVHQFEIMPKPPGERAPHRRRGPCGRCNCAPRVRTKRAAFATGHQQREVYGRYKRKREAVARHARRSTAEVRTAAGNRVHARCGSGAAGDGLSGSGALRE
jgi:NADPH-dependent glutamate synthase beta subunit-like oxidoreductase